MRNAAVLASVAVFVTLSIQAQAPQPHPGTTSVSVMLSEPTYTSTDARGGNFHGGYAASLNYWWTPRWSSELSVTREHRAYSIVSLDANGDFIVRRQSVDSHPIDLNAQYHFFTSGRWKPYLGAGIRYLSTPAALRSSRQIAPELNGGVVFELTPHLGIKLDAKAIAGSDKWPGYDHGLKSAIGITWRF
jgi:hypothetical protein